MEQSSSCHLPKRVVLLFKMGEFDQDIVQAFLRYSARPETEYFTEKLAIHLDPGRQEHEAAKYLAHLVIDIDADRLQAPNLTSLPHEIYKVRHNEDGQMYVILWTIYLAMNLMQSSCFRLVDSSKHRRYYEEVQHFTNYLSWNFEADRRRHQIEDARNHGGLI